MRENFGYTNKPLKYMLLKKQIKEDKVMTNNKAVLTWLQEMADMTKPEQIVWIDGSEVQLEALRAEAVATGEMIKLNQR